MNLSRIDQRILNHYEHRWGTPTRIHTFDSPNVPVVVRPLFVAEFSLPADQLTVYASIGMSRVPMSSPTEQEDHRVEIFLGTFVALPQLPERIAMLAAYPHIGKTFIGVEHTVPLGEPIVPNSGMTFVIFCSPYFDPPEFRRVEINAYHAQILWVIPLHESERQFKVTYGWDALMKVFEEKHVMVGDLFRDALV